EVRSRLMPVNRACNLETLMAAVRRYPLAPRQRVLLEHVLLDGVNDAPEDAQRPARPLRNVPARVHLTPLNDWPGADFRRPPPAVVVVTTCTVTASAEVADRQAIRRARRANPDARVVVTGCWAQTSAAEVAREPGVDLIVGNADKERLPALLQEVLSGPRAG